MITPELIRALHLRHPNPQAAAALRSWASVGAFGLSRCLIKQLVKRGTSESRL